MECSTCNQFRKDFICNDCRQSDTLAHQSRLSQFTSERDALVKGAAEAINGPLYAARAKRADVALLQRRVEEVQQHVGVLRKENDSGASAMLFQYGCNLYRSIARERISIIRATLSTRRDTLARANVLSTYGQSSPPRTPTPTLPGGPPRRSPFRPPSSTSSASVSDQQAQLDQLKEAHATLQDALAKARQGLIAELVDVFDLAEVGGRPSLGVRAGTRGEWTIVAPGLVFPVPGDIRRTNTIHLALISHK